MESCEAWSLLVPLNLMYVLLWLMGHHRGLLSAFSIFLLEYSRLDEQTSYTLLSGVHFSAFDCHSFQIYFTYQPLGEPFPTAPAWTMPQLLGPVCLSITCIIDSSCAPFSLWYSNPLMAENSFMWSFIYVAYLAQCPAPRPFHE